MKMKNWFTALDEIALKAKEKILEAFF